MKTHAYYGIGIAVGGAVLMLILNLLGFHNDPGKFLIGMGLGFLGAIAITIIGLVMGIRAVRKEKGPGKFTYGNAFMAGLLITIFNTAVGTTFQVAYAKLINPDYSETAVKWVQGMMEKANKPQDEIDTKLAEMREKSGAFYQVRNGVIGGLVFGSIISLIAAAALKREAEDPSGVKSV